MTPIIHLGPEINDNSFAISHTAYLLFMCLELASAVNYTELYVKCCSVVLNCYREHAPSIIFMDEIDSIGSTRLESGSGGDSEVQRTMLELLNQLDGFEPKQNIKVTVHLVLGKI